MLNGEKPVGEYKSMFMMGEMNVVNRFILSSIAKLVMPRAYLYFFQKKPLKQIIEYQNHIGKISELRLKWIEYWR